MAFRSLVFARRRPVSLGPKPMGSCAVLLLCAAPFLSAAQSAAEARVSKAREPPSQAPDEVLSPTPESAGNDAPTTRATATPAGISPSQPQPTANGDAAQREFRRRALRIAPKAALQGWQLNPLKRSIRGYKFDGTVLSTAELLREVGDDDLADHVEFAEAVAQWSAPLAAGILVTGMTIGVAAALTFSAALASQNHNLLVEDVAFFNTTGMIVGMGLGAGPAIFVALGPFLFPKPSDAQILAVVRSHNLELALDVGVPLRAIPPAYLGAE